MRPTLPVPRPAPLVLVPFVFAPWSRPDPCGLEIPGRAFAVAGRGDKRWPIPYLCISRRRRAQWSCSSEDLWSNTLERGVSAFVYSRNRIVNTLVLLKKLNETHHERIAQSRMTHIMPYSSQQQRKHIYISQQRNTTVHLGSAPLPPSRGHT
jgi:hypothetical protein